MSEKSVAKVRPSSMAVLVLFWEQEEHEDEEEREEQVDEEGGGGQMRPITSRLLNLSLLED